MNYISVPNTLICTKQKVPKILIQIIQCIETGLRPIWLLIILIIRHTNTDNAIVTSDNTDIQTNLDSIETEISASIKTTTNMKATTDIKINTHINAATNRRDSVCD